LRELRRLAAPERMATQAQALNAVLVEAQKLREGRSGTKTERVVGLFETRLRLLALEAQITAGASTEEEVRYSNALAVAAGDRDRDHQDQVNELARALSELIAHLEGLRTPQRRRPQHEAVCHALRQEFVAASAYYAAFRGSDVDEVRRTIDAYQDALAARSKRFKELGFYEIFPAR
jgi:hypothetical protein